MSPISRRDLLARSTAAALAVWSGPGLGVRLVAADDDVPARDPSRRRRVLVPIFLRGGADGLNMVVPYAEETYHRARPTIAVPRGSVIDLDGAFGLHPALAAFGQLHREGRLGIVHAVGHEASNRSHFEEQDRWETARIGSAAASDGWVNRYLAGHEGTGPVRAVAFGAALPRLLSGRVPVQVVRDLGDLRLRTPSSRRDATRAALERLYAGSDEAMARVGDEALEAVRVLSRLDPAAYRPEPGAVYPESPLGNQLKQTAQLVKAEVGLEVAEVDVGGWDTHQAQGGLEGPQAGLMRDLAGSIAAFLADLGERAGDVLVLTLTEFGRTVRENGTGGTDHGLANCLFAAGGTVAPGLHGRFSGLDPEALESGRDLAHTTDFRDVLAEVVEEHLGGRAPDVLPDHEPGTRVGLVG